MLSENELIAEIAAALEINSAELSMDSVSSDVDAWDSLGHITILTRLDDKLQNVSERAPSLAEAMSIREIWTILNSLREE